LLRLLDRIARRDKPPPQKAGRLGNSTNAPPVSQALFWLTSMAR
jgi:hypothetical protein